jgi:hypothetical protein
MGQTIKYMSTLIETQYWDRWGHLKLRLAQKNDVKNFEQNMQSGCAKCSHRRGESEK